MDEQNKNNNIDIINKKTFSLRSGRTDPKSTLKGK